MHVEFQFLKRHQLTATSGRQMDFTPTCSISDGASDIYCDISSQEMPYSPQSLSPLADRQMFNRLSPLARWKLQSKMEDSFFLPIPQDRDDEIVGALSGKDESPPSPQTSGHTNKYSSQNTDDKQYMNYLKIKQIRSAFSISSKDDKKSPSSGRFSHSHMFALKKRIIKQEEELHGAQRMGSDGSSGQSSSGSSPEVGMDSPEADHDNDDPSDDKVIHTPLYFCKE